jgi:hypothetical protein
VGSVDGVELIQRVGRETFAAKVTMSASDALRCAPRRALGGAIGGVASSDGRPLGIRVRGATAELIDITTGDAIHSLPEFGDADQWTLAADHDRAIACWSIAQAETLSCTTSRL